MYIHPLPIRLWHWLNALGVVILLLSGAAIRFSWPNLGAWVSLHNFTGFAVMANYLLWLGFYLLTDRIKVYHSDLNIKRYAEKTFKQIKFYSYDIFVGGPNPHKVEPYDKFNALQKVMYQIIMLLVMPLQFYTGWLLYTGTIAWAIPVVHTLVFIFFCFFIFVHIYLGSLGHTRLAHFKEMVTGYED